jgi:hypothetical protein
MNIRLKNMDSRKATHRTVPEIRNDFHVQPGSKLFCAMKAAMHKQCHTDV